MDSLAGGIANLAHAYRVLDVPQDASARAIRSNYRKLVKRWHPDRYKPGSAEHREATEMTSLLNAAYARIQDAPLRPGYAKPFSTPRNQPIDPDAPKKPEPPPPFDAGWSHNEHSPRTTGVSDADFIRIREYARKAGAKDDAARPSYRRGTILRVIFGACFGAVFALAAHPRRMDFSVRWTLIEMTIGAVFVGCMVWLDRRGH